MAMSRDADEAVVASPELLQASEETGTQIGQLICDSNSGECLSVLMLMPFLPPVGSTIRLQNNARVVVESITFQTISTPPGIFLLRPVVKAVFHDPTHEPD